MYSNINPLGSRIASARPKNSSQRVSFNLPGEDVYQTDGSRTTNTGDSSGNSKDHNSVQNQQENSNKIGNKARIQSAQVVRPKNTADSLTGKYERRNTAQDFLDTFESVKKSATEKEEKNENSKNIDDELVQMLKVARNAKDAVQEMNDAFTGDMDNSEYVANFDKNNKMRVRKVYQRKKAPRGNSETLNRLRSAIPRALPPIEEEPRDESAALVPMTYHQ